MKSSTGTGERRFLHQRFASGGYLDRHSLWSPRVADWQGVDPPAASTGDGDQRQPSAQEAMGRGSEHPFYEWIDASVDERKVHSRAPAWASLEGASRLLNLAAMASA